MAYDGTWNCCVPPMSAHRLLIALTVLAVRGAPLLSQTDGTCVPVAELARESRSTVIASLGRIWLFNARDARRHESRA